MTSAHEGFVLDGLNLNDGVNFVIEDLGFKPAAKRPLWIENPDADGDLLADEPHYGNLEFNPRVRVLPRATTDLGIVALSQITDKIQKCARYRDAGGLAGLWTPADSTKPYTFYALLGEMTDLPITPTGDLAGWFVKSPIITFKLSCRPFLYADEATVLASTSSTAPLQVAYIPNVGGDVAAEARLNVLDLANQDRRHLEWGMDQIARMPATNLILNPSFEVDAVGWTGFNGTLTRTNVTGAAAGDWALQVSPTGTPTQMGASTPVAFTPSRTYSVRVAVWVGGGDAQASMTLTVTDALGMTGPTVKTFDAIPGTWTWVTVEGVTTGGSVGSDLHVWLGNPAGGTFGEPIYMDGFMLIGTTPAGVSVTPKSPATVATGVDPYSVVVSPDGLSAYVVNYTANTVSQYDIGSGGVLTPKSPATVATGVGPRQIAISPNGTSAYVTNSNEDTLSQYTIGSGGALTPKSPATVATGDDPRKVAVSPDSVYVYVTNYSANTLSQYLAASNGTLTPLSPATVATGTGPYTVAVRPDGFSVYLVDVGSNTISQYTIGSGGVLTPKSPATVATDTGPRDLVVSPDGLSVYATNYAAGTVSQYTVGSGGVLTAKSPATVAAGGGTRGIAMSPDGLSVYAADTLDDTVSQYSVGSGGVLSPKSPATIATGDTPYSLTVSPDGLSLYVADVDAYTVSQYDVTAVSAAATTVRDYFDGDTPDCFWTGTRGSSPSTTGQSLIIDSDDMTTSGFAGTQATQTGANDPNADGLNVITMTAIAQPVTLCQTPIIGLVGSFRVKARVYASDVDARYRVAYKVGDGLLQALDFTQAIVVNGFCEIDLGEITLDQVTRGPQRSIINIDTKSTTTFPTAKLDYLELIPTHRYGRARGLLPPGASNSMTAWDGFNQAGNPVLSGQTADGGGAWSGGGAASGYSVGSTFHNAQRTALSDAADAGRFEWLGGTKAAVTVSGVLSATNTFVTRLGWNLRYVDASNYAMAVVDSNGYYRLLKRVAGTITQLGALFIGYSYGSLAVTITTDGVWALTATAPGMGFAAGSDPVFATGGALASGKQGIYDEVTGATPITRFVDNINISVPPVANRIVYSGQSIDLDSTSALRCDAAGVYRGDVYHRGSHFYLDPAGDEGRVTRLAVKMRRGDVDLEADANIADAQTIKVTARGRYLAPR